MSRIMWILFLMCSILIACELPGPQRDELNKEQEMIQPEMVRIEGGTVDPFGAEETVTVSPFYLDKHLITYEQYNQFIEAGGYKEKKYWSKGRAQIP